MKNVTIEDSQGSACETFDATLRMLTGKWKGGILYRLSQRTHRFGELKRAIPGITQHMLTVQLRELEADGLVERTVFAEVPPRVEYALTDAARALRPVFEALLRWSQEHGAGSRTHPSASRDRSEAAE